MILLIGLSSNEVENQGADYKGLRIEGSTLYQFATFIFWIDSILHQETQM